MKVARFRVTLNAVLGSAPVDEVRAVVDFARAMGCRPSLQLVHGDDGSMDLTKEELRAFHDIQHELGRNLRSDDYRMQLVRDGLAPYKCRAGSRYLYVDEHGIVRWCSQQRFGFGIPLADYDRDDLKRQFHTRKECSESCTVGCVRNCSRVRPVSLAAPGPGGRRGLRPVRGSRAAADPAAPLGTAGAGE